MKRLFDLVFGILILASLGIPILVLALAVRATSKGPAFYWSDRVGYGNKIFRMPKFRTMKLDAPAVASHLIKDPDVYLSPIGKFLRRTSLDEMPQLLSILKGDMSFVGPRPALFNQYDLISLRTETKVNQLVPGLTGWAQINGRDELSISEKVKFDVEYMQMGSFWFDMKILWITFLRVFKGVGVSH